MVVTDQHAPVNRRDIVQKPFRGWHCKKLVSVAAMLTIIQLVIKVQSTALQAVFDIIRISISAMDSLTVKLA